MSLALNISLCHVMLLMLPLNMVFCEEMKDFYPEERAALLLIRDSFLRSSSNLQGNWTGPPCTENQSRWKGITCSNWHVIYIVLEGFNLSGSLPPTSLQNITFLRQVNFRNNSIFGRLPNLTNLVFLEHVSLSKNHFSGPIPMDYVGLPNLKELELQENFLDGQIPPFDQPSLTSFNVSYNHLVGLIPETSILQRFQKSSFGNNSDLCGMPLDKSCPAHFSSQPPFAIAPSPAVEKPKKIFLLKTIVYIAAASVLLFFSIIAFKIYNKRASVKEETTRNDAAGYTFGAWAKNMTSYSEDFERLRGLEFLHNELPAFDLDDLLRASGEMLGVGNLGITYKATFETGAVVAVKRLNNYMNELNKKDFLQQMQLLGKLKHENLTEIISFYYQSEEQKLVIYEFISNGNLFDLLHVSSGLGRRRPLDWNARLSIIKDIAKGVAFLHQSLSSHKVPHGNLKSSNVLIQHDSQGGYQAKLTDFGFFPLLLTSKNLARKLAISKSPEFVQGKKLTHKTDVYCFGIIMLEIITGKIPGEILGGDMEETTCDLSEWVRMVVDNDWSTDILDEEILAENEGHDSMLQLTEIALECTDLIPKKRPKMSQVLRKLEEIEQMKPDND